MVLNKTRKAKQQNDLKKTGDGHIKYYSLDVKRQSFTFTE